MRHSAFALIVLAGLSSAGCTVYMDAEEQVAREDKRFAVSASPEVVVSTFDGPIEVRSWDRNEVLVEIEKKAADEDGLKSIEVRADHQGNRVEVEVVRPRGRDTFVGIGVHISPHAKLTVSMPRQGTLEARSGDGSIRAERLEGKITLRTSDGSVTATGIKGEMDVESGDGSVTIEDADGAIRVSTGDGGIRSTGRFDSLDVKSGDGSVTVRAEPGSEMKSDWSLRTEDGSVALYLPDSFNGELDARTGDGVVRSEFEVQGARTEGRDRNRGELRGRLGTGGKLLRIRTGDGTISLRNW
jgi:hypothetical protein